MGIVPILSQGTVLARSGDCHHVPTVTGTMTLRNPLWREFANRLSGPEGVNLREGARGDVIWDCGLHTLEHTQAILRDMGATDGDLASSLHYFDVRGATCDCEVVLNVDTEPLVRLGE